MEEKHLIVAITGASGAAYARMLLHTLSQEAIRIHLVASQAGKSVYDLEIGKSLEDDLPQGVSFYDENDLTAPFASGSFLSKGMVVVPCSMGTLAAIANGISRNLILRAAFVCLKEGRRLVLVPRETPLNSIHLRNMLRLSKAGGIILPAMPGFYHQPQAVDDLVRFIVARIIEQLQMSQNLLPPWGPGNSSGISA
jgi:4-hydroxy-3-polyprenylbenzoate decarboxylase